jgi:hypothetical protein
MTWILFIVITTYSVLGNTTPHATYFEQIGPFISEKSCNSAKAIIGKDVNNAKLYCFQTEKK